MHTLSTAFVLGYHGCDRSVGEQLLKSEPFRPSQNPYDWLGSGVYFWESNPRRALAFAGEVKSRSGDISEPFVVGAVVELGTCLDLTTTSGIEMVRAAYLSLQASSNAARTPMPVNKRDFLLRYLDCMVVNRVHAILDKTGSQPIDTVKGIFTEGDPIYDGAGFMEKTHTQICVCNHDCIKGVFRVQERDLADH